MQVANHKQAYLHPTVAKCYGLLAAIYDSHCNEGLHRSCFRGTFNLNVSFTGRTLNGHCVFQFGSQRLMWRMLSLLFNSVFWLRVTLKLSVSELKLKTQARLSGELPAEVNALQ